MHICSSAWIWTGASVGGALVLLVVLAYLAKPAHVRVWFGPFGEEALLIPPVVARVNEPSADARERLRTVRLPTGDEYVIPPGSRGHFVLVFDWTVHVQVGAQEVPLVVPRLSTTDFASIPRVLHSLISPLTNTVYAAIVHDYLYRNPQVSPWREMDRRTADRVLYWGMRAKGVTRVTAWVMWLGVRLGGRGSYRRPSSESQAR